jgi:hypothetical protein
MVIHTCNPSTQEVGSGIPGQPGLHNETLQKTKKIKINKLIEVEFSRMV